MTSTTHQSLRYRTRQPRLAANLEQESLQKGSTLLPRLSPRPPTPSSTPRPLSTTARPPSSPRPRPPPRPILAAPLRLRLPTAVDRTAAPGGGCTPCSRPNRLPPRGGALSLTATWDSPAKSPPRTPPSSKLPRPRDCQLCTIQPMTASLTEARKGQIVPPGHLR